MNNSKNKQNTETQLGDFTHQAETYHKARPRYPDELIDRLCELFQLGKSDCVADIGAGTGIFTQQLASRDLHVNAVEPNASMRELAAKTPNVTWIEGTFEKTGLPDRSQDWIVAAQAFHWADPPRALPEMHRILQPGRRFTVLWNNRMNNDSPALAEAWSIIKKYVPDFEDNYRELDWAEVLPSTGHFSDTQIMESHHTIDMPTERFLNLWRSHNRLNQIAGPQRFSQIMETMEEALKSSGIDGVPVPYLCRAWSATRVSH